MAANCTFKNELGYQRFTDLSVDELDISKVEGLVRLLALLCGQDVSLPCRSSYNGERCQQCSECINFQLLEKLTTNGGLWDHSRFNQALLLLNQPTVSPDFYSAFFGNHGTVKELKQGVVDFRGVAMLTFGNFRFAYKQLAPMKFSELETNLDKHLELPQEIIRRYKSRPLREPLLHSIEDGKRWYLGYISGDRLNKDNASLYALQCHLGYSKKEDVEQELLEDRQKDYFNRRLEELSKCALGEWESCLDDIRNRLYEMQRDLMDLQNIGWTNTAEYLTSDYLDVYVATSMRESWEYESTAKFVRKVLGTSKVKELRLRYFDPTLSFLKNRIDKGLVEGLMLKRAKCTLYMVQETDTLGKDSELASTLAQGKPVIAYVPQHSQNELEKELQSMHLRLLKQRAMLFMMEGDLISKNNLREITDFIATASKFSPVFELVGDEEPNFCRKQKIKLSKVRKIISAAEKKYLDKRARSLMRDHPLAIQVHLDTGVANGVLVVRSPTQCAQLLVNLLTNQTEFSIEREGGTTVLREKISQCPYRVVTDDPTVTNSFWNFYLTNPSIPKSKEVFKSKSNLLYND